MTDNIAKQAYWVSDLIEPDLKARKIPWHTHDGERVLIEYLRKNKFTINERAPTFKELGVTNIKRQQDRMRLVYAPLYSAVVSMREGKDDIPKGYTAGTPINAWSTYPEITERVIAIFSNYPDLVDNEIVWKGWLRKEAQLRKKEFWLDGETYQWFDAIENEYDRIKSELGGATT